MHFYFTLIAMATRPQAVEQVERLLAVTRRCNAKAPEETPDVPALLLLIPPRPGTRAALVSEAADGQLALHVRAADVHSPGKREKSN